MVPDEATLVGGVVAGVSGMINRCQGDVVAAVQAKGRRIEERLKLAPVKRLNKASPLE